MNLQDPKIKRPVALVILDGWGYAPRTEGNAIAIANTPNYDEICRSFPMTVLTASGSGDGQTPVKPGNAEAGHLSIGTGRAAQTEVSRISDSIRSGAFMENPVLKDAFAKAKGRGADVHLIGLMSDGGINSSTDHLFALLRMAKQDGLTNVYVHCILDGLDVPPRTADIYVEALEIKLADIGVGSIATLCGRFFAMDNGENWERTARAYTMLVHAEGERVSDPVTAIRNSFLRGISDEFISPIIIEKSPDVPVAKIKTGDVVVFFNHHPDAMRQLVRSVSVADESTGAKPIIDTVCLTDYDQGLGLPAAFSREAEKNSLTEVLSENEVPNIRITENERFRHLTYFFDGGTDLPQRFAQHILVPNLREGTRFGQPESESFRITDKLLRGLESTGTGVFVVNIPAADMMAETGDLVKTVAAIQFIDTCLGSICEKLKQLGGVVMITSTHGNCEEMLDPASGERSFSATANPVPFHYVDDRAGEIALRDDGALEDIAPTILGVLGIEKPADMTGTDLRGA